MQVGTIIAQIETLKKELERQYPHDEFEMCVEVAHRTVDSFSDYAFDEEDIEELNEGSFISLFFFKLFRCHEDYSRNKVYESQLALDGLLIPLYEDGRSDILKLSIRLVEPWINPIVNEEYVVTNQQQYEDVLNRFHETIMHHFQLVGLKNEYLIQPKDKKNN